MNPFRLIPPAAAVLGLLGLSACAIPAHGTASASASHGYEEPDTGSMFGGGDSHGENTFTDPGLTGQPAGLAAPGGRP